jgi:hypothetical protein
MRCLWVNGQEDGALAPEPLDLPHRGRPGILQRGPMESQFLAA